MCRRDNSTILRYVFLYNIRKYIFCMFFWGGEGATTIIDNDFIPVTYSHNSQVCNISVDHRFENTVVDKVKLAKAIFCEQLIIYNVDLTRPENMSYYKWFSESAFKRRFSANYHLDYILGWRPLFPVVHGILLHNLKQSSWRPLCTGMGSFVSC